MTKKEILDLIDDFLGTEETASAVYLQHLSAIITRSYKSKNEQARMKKLIEYLISENKKHQQLLTNLGAKIREEELNVY